MRSHHVGLSLLAASAVALVGGRAAGQCEPAWSPGFGPTGFPAGVHDIVVFDDGSGPAIYAGGEFTTDAGAVGNLVARFDGRTWSAVGGEPLGTVRSLVVYDEDGEGPLPASLLAAGEVRLSHTGPTVIARWDGSVWTALASHSGSIRCMAVLNGGVGGTPTLHVGGSHITWVGGVLAQNAAMWDGQAWSAMGGGVSGAVNAMIVADLGDGPTLYAGGEFANAGGVPVGRVAGWDGEQWVGLGGGVEGWVYSLAAFDDGRATALYAGGLVHSGGGVPSPRLARWDGAGWSEASEGLEWVPRAMVVHDRGRGPALYAAGSGVIGRTFEQGGVATLEGSRWVRIDELTFGLPPARALCVFDADEDGPNRGTLFVAHAATSLQNQRLRGVTEWSDAGWRTVGSGAGTSPGTIIRTMTVLDLDDGPRLVACDPQSGLPPLDAPGSIAAWDGVEWTRVNQHGAGGARELVMLGTEDGPALHAVGQVSGRAGLTTVFGAVRWTGSAWSPLGDGIGSTSTPPLTAAVHDDGSGPRLFAAGAFTMAGSVPVNRVAAWNGAQWSAVGGGFGDGAVNDLVVFDEDGPGPMAAGLFAGGSFQTSGRAALSGVARWNGTAWMGVQGSPFTPGEPRPRPQVLAALERPYSGAPERALYAGGLLNAMGTGLRTGVSRWSAGAWAQVGGDFESASGVGTIHTLAALETGNVSHLYAAGAFASAGGVPARSIAAWDGSGWSALGEGIEGTVYSLAVFDEDREGPNPGMLYASGLFQRAGGFASSNLARWGAPIPAVVAQPHDRRVVAGRGVGFTVEAGGASPRSYQWRRDGEPLTDGGPVSGATTSTLVIEPASMMDVGEYDCVIVNACGATRSLQAMLEVLCAADWNEDLAVNSMDINGFVSSWLASVTSGAGPGDFNGDGVVDGADIGEFLASWLAAVSGGC